MKKNVMIKILLIGLFIVCIKMQVSCKSSDKINIKGDWNVTHFICGDKYILPTALDIPANRVKSIYIGKGNLGKDKLVIFKSKLGLKAYEIKLIKKITDSTYSISIENCRKNGEFEEFKMVVKEVTTEYDEQFLLNEVTATLTSSNSTIILFRPRFVDRKTGKLTQHVLYY